MVVKCFRVDTTKAGISDSYSFRIPTIGSENKQLQETLIKLNGVMAVTQSLQAIGTELTREDSIVKVVAGKATDIYSWAVSGATLKMKLFRLALIGTGIGGIILLIVSLTSSWLSGRQVSHMGSTCSAQSAKKRAIYGLYGSGRLRRAQIA